jgi:PAS domain S-box-containing protein
MYSTQSPHADLFKLQTLGVSQTDVPTGQLVRVNAAFCTLLGYTEQELIALTNKAIMHPEDWQGEWDPYKGDRAPEFEAPKRYLRKDGSILWLEQTLNVYANASRFSVYREVDIKRRFGAKAKPTQVTVCLNTRDRIILTRLTRGWEAKEIACELGVSLSTLHKHITNLYGKLGVRSWTEAVAWAIKHGQV